MIVNIFNAFIYYLFTIVFSTFVFLLLDSTHFHGLELEDKENHSLVTKFFDRLYFSSTTLSTVGYGDITPKSHMAKMVTIVLQFISTIGIISIIQNSLS